LDYSNYLVFIVPELLDQLVEYVIWNRWHDPTAKLVKVASIDREVVYRLSEDRFAALGEDRMEIWSASKAMVIATDQGKREQEISSVYPFNESRVIGEAFCGTLHLIVILRIRDVCDYIGL
jgi:hypothetical protein